MKLTNELVVFDLETTGTWIDKDKIVEIAMIKCLPDGAQKTFHKKINPGIPIPPRVSELIGITDNDVKEAPVLKKIVKEVIDFIGGADLAGFNIERFDLPLLEREIRECGQAFEWKNRKIYDAQKIFHLNEKRDLTAAYKYYCDKDLEGAHSALVDTKATLKILESQVSRYGDPEEAVDVLSKFNYKKTADFYDEDRKFRWWNKDLYMTFGKYAQKYTLQEVTKKDPKYLEWILSANFSPEVKGLVEDALKGIFPSYIEEGVSGDKKSTLDEQATLFD